MAYSSAPRHAWTWRTNGNVQGGAAVDGEMALVAGRGKRLTALSRLDGSELWSAELDRGTSATPLIAGGLAIIGDESAAVRAFHLETGAEAWRTGLGQPLAATAVSVGALVLVGTGAARPMAGDGAIVALDAATGQIVWQRAAPGGCRSAPAIAGDIAVFATRGGEALALACADGRELWRAAIRPTDADVTAAGGLAIAISTSGTIWAHDVAAGEEIWFFETGQPAPRGGTALAGKLVIAGAADGRLYGLDAATGEVAWTVERRGPREWASWSPPEIADGVAMATADDGVRGTLIGVDAASGRELWSLPLDAWNSARPAAQGRSVVITASTNTPGAAQLNFG